MVAWMNNVHVLEEYLDPIDTFTGVLASRLHGISDKYITTKAVSLARYYGLVTFPHHRFDVRLWSQRPVIPGRGH